MTLPASGAISMANVNVELSLPSTSTISLNDAAVRTLFGKATGAIALGDGYGKSNALTGQAAFTEAGTFTWTAPATLVSSISVVAVGGGGSGRWNGCDSSWPGGGGGALSYRNNISVTGGRSYTVVVGAGGPGPNDNGSPSSLKDNVNQGVQITAYGGSRPTSTSNRGLGGLPPSCYGYSGGAGGAGGLQQCNAGGGGGGAGGYSGTGGQGGTPDFAASPFSVGAAGTGGAGGGAPGGGRQGGKNPSGFYGGKGGGVGLLGEGTSGAKKNGSTSNFGSGGNPGSGGSGEYFGGGGGGGGMGLVDCNCDGPYYAPNQGQPGAFGGLRIIYPGNNRSFPNTNTGDL